MDMRPHASSAVVIGWSVTTGAQLLLAGRQSAAGLTARTANVRGVQDESLIDEMRAALKGDRERAKANRRKPRSDASWIGAAPSSEPAGARRPTLLTRLGLRRRKS